MSRSMTWVCAVTAVVVLLSCMGFVAPIDFAVAVAFGWIWYLVRTLPQVQPASAGVVTAAACLVLFVVGSQFFLGWLYSEIRNRNGTSGSPHSRWKWRWTLGLAAVIVVMFVAGMATVGVTHQLGWLLTSREPWLASDSGVRDAARRAWSQNNLKQIGLAVQSYEQAHGSLPPGGTFDRRGRPVHGWQAMILPYVEQKELYDRIDFSNPWNGLQNAPVFRTEIATYQNPGIRERTNAAGFALSHYAANVSLLGGDHPRKFTEVTDGTSNTLLAGEVTAGFKAWGDPTNWRDPTLGLNSNPAGFASPYPGGVNFLMADGSVHFIKNTVDKRVLKALSTPAGGEKVSSDQY